MAVLITPKAQATPGRRPTTGRISANTPSSAPERRGLRPGPRAPPQGTTAWRETEDGSARF